MYFPHGVDPVICSRCGCYRKSSILCASTYDAKDVHRHKTCVCLLVSSNARAVCCPRGYANLLRAQPCLDDPLVEAPNKSIRQYVIASVPGTLHLMCTEAFDFERQCAVAAAKMRRTLNYMKKAQCITCAAYAIVQPSQYVPVHSQCSQSLYERCAQHLPCFGALQQRVVCCMRAFEYACEYFPALIVGMRERPPLIAENTFLSHERVARTRGSCEEADASRGRTTLGLSRRVHQHLS